MVTKTDTKACGKTGWAVSDAPVAYPDALAAMTARAEAIARGEAGELVWLLEHPPLYTAGTSARIEDLKDPGRFPVFEAGRGGQFTYHGPGQRVAYVMLDLTVRGRDVRAFVDKLEAWIIDTLAAFNVKGERRTGRVGVWVDQTRPGGPLHEDKIAAIGVRLKRWVSFHGISINVEPDLSHFEGIVPCGIDIRGLGVTSLVAIGRTVTLVDVDCALKTAFERQFGPVAPEPAPI
jgi:lipoyl(octanoyl) transferase